VENTGIIRFASWWRPLRYYHLSQSLHNYCTDVTQHQTLHDVSPSPGLAHYVYIFGGSCPLMGFCQVHNSLCVQVLRSPILAAKLCTIVQGMELQNFRRRHHLYSAGRPSRLALAHILVLFFSDINISQGSVAMAEGWWEEFENWSAIQMLVSIWQS